MEAEDDDFRKPFASGDELAHAISSSEVESLNNGLLRLGKHLQDLHNPETGVSPTAVIEYIEAHPDFKEIWTAFDKSSDAQVLVLPVLNVIAYMISAPIAMQPQRMRLFRTLVRTHTRQFFRSVANLKSSIAAAALRILTNGALAGGATDLLEMGFVKAPHDLLAVPLTFQAMSKSDTTVGGLTPRAFPETAKQYIRYVLSLLKSGDVTIQKILLETRNFANCYLPAIGELDHELVEETLAVYDKHILNNANLPKSVKVSYFSSYAVTHLLKLYDRPPPDGNADSEPLGHKFMLGLCTRPGHGICWRDYGFYPQQAAPSETRTLDQTSAGAVAAGTTGASASFALQNRILAIVIRSIEPLDSPYQEELLFRILTVCPELRADYLEDAKWSLQVRASLRWIFNINIICRILEMPVPAFTIEHKRQTYYPAQPPPLTTLLANIIPPSHFSRHVMNSSMRSESVIVRQATLRLFVTVLKKLDVVLVALDRGAQERRARASDADTTSWTLMREQLIGSTFRVLPERRDLFDVLQQCLPHLSGDDEAALAQSEVLYVGLTRFLTIACKLNPEFLRGFDYAKLLVDIPPLPLLPTLFGLLGQVSFAFNPSSMAALLHIYTNTDGHLKSATAALAVRKLSATSVFEPCPREIATWLRCLSGSSSIVFFTNLFGKAMTDLSRYLDIISATTSRADANDAETVAFPTGAGLPFSPLLMALMEALSQGQQGSDEQAYAVRVLCQIAVLSPVSPLLSAICHQQHWESAAQLVESPQAAFSTVDGNMQDAVYLKMKLVLSDLDSSSAMTADSLIACLPECRRVLPKDRFDELAQSIFASPQLHRLFETRPLEVSYLIRMYGDAELAEPYLEQLFAELMSSGEETAPVVKQSFAMLVPLASSGQLAELAQHTSDTSLLTLIARFTPLPFSAVPRLMDCVDDGSASVDAVDKIILDILTPDRGTSAAELDAHLSKLTIPQAYMSHLLASGDITLPLLVRLIEQCPDARRQALALSQKRRMEVSQACVVLAALVRVMASGTADATTIDAIKTAAVRQNVADVAFEAAEQVELCEFLLKHGQAKPAPQVKLSCNGLKVGELVARSQGSLDKWMTEVLQATVGHYVAKGGPLQSSVELRIRHILRHAGKLHLDAKVTSAFLTAVLTAKPAASTWLLVHAVLQHYQRNMDPELGLDALYKMVVAGIDKNELQSEPPSPSKTAYVLALHSLISLNPAKLCKSDYLDLLLAAYNASLHPADRLILDVLRMYEVHASTPLGSRALCWGARSLDLRASFESRSAGGLSLPAVEEALGLIGRNRMLALICDFPADQPLERACDVDDNLSKLVDLAEYCVLSDVSLPEPLYDLCWFLPLCYKFLECGNGIDISKLIATNIIGLAVAALSSQRTEVRQAGYVCLDELYTLLETTNFRERQQVQLLLASLKHNVADRDTPMPVPSLLTAFVAQSLSILARPEHDMYRLVSAFILKYPILSLTDVPLRQELLSPDGKEQFKQQRWIIRWLHSSISSDEDFQLLKRRHIWDTLASLALSSLSDSFVREALFELLTRLVRMESALRDVLVYGGLLPLLSVITGMVPASDQPYGDTALSYLRLLSVIRDTLAQGTWRHVEIQRAQVELAAAALFRRTLASKRDAVTAETAAWWANIVSVAPPALVPAGLRDELAVAISQLASAEDQQDDDLQLNKGRYDFDKLVDISGPAIRAAELRHVHYDVAFLRESLRRS
ncbi:hypothetical protein RI367_008296 [Sorochytrium milnesiophthora]